MLDKIGPYTQNCGEILKIIISVEFSWVDGISVEFSWVDGINYSVLS